MENKLPKVDKRRSKTIMVKHVPGKESLTLLMKEKKTLKKMCTVFESFDLVNEYEK